MEKWIKENEGKIFRFLIYKKMFTPYEQQEAFSDESQFEENYYNIALLKEAVDLGCGNWLIGFEMISDHKLSGITQYHRLQDIRLEYFDCDQDILTRGDDDDEEGEYFDLNALDWEDK